MVAPADVEGFLAALTPGRSMWLTGLGQSMWPVLASGDAVRVVRCAPAELARGDIAVVRTPLGLAAHVVVGLEPLRTASMTGRLDGGADPLGRVDAVRTRGRSFELPRASRWVLLLVAGANGLARRALSRVRRRA